MKYVFLKNINTFDAHIIEDVLKNNNVDFFFKTPYESSVNAGWVTPGASFNEKKLFVVESKLSFAKEILRGFL